MASEELFGYVTLVEGYDLNHYKGIHALIKLRDDPETTIMVYSTDATLANLLTSALQGENLVAVRVEEARNPPKPLGGTTDLDEFTAYAVILYK